MRVIGAFKAFNVEWYDVEKVLAQVVESTLIVWEDFD